MNLCGNNLILKKMKKKFLKKTSFVLLIVVMLFGSFASTHAENKKRQELVSSAVNVLKGIDTSNSKEWAVSLLLEAATNDSVVEAMNGLGLIYLVGNGVEKDTIAAVQWLEKAGKVGYPLAYHNLGMLYKDGKYGVSQDFKKAYEYFSYGASLGSVICKYEQGFMLYKGLGCQQSYENALSLFEEGAAADYSPSLYMLGLCYRNGYGVKQDTVRASAYLKFAASRNYTPAMEELRRVYPENDLCEASVLDNNFELMPNEIPSISPKANDASMLNGFYRGILAIYDWSGKFILGEKPIEIVFKQIANGKFDGGLKLDNDSIPFVATLSETGKMKFSADNLRMEERYINGQKVNYRIDEAMLDIWQDKIVGKLNLYSLKLKEPERPMYLELRRVDRELSRLDSCVNTIVVSPNPFLHDINATFELMENGEVSIRIYNKSGLLVYKENLGFLEAGKHNVSITPKLKNDMYVLHVKADQQVFRAIIVKNGGV